jgi:hypothetical protein
VAFTVAILGHVYIAITGDRKGLLADLSSKRQELWLILSNGRAVWQSRSQSPLTEQTGGKEATVALRSPLDSGCIFSHKKWQP